MRFAVPVLLLLAAVDGSALPVLLAAVLVTLAMAVAAVAASVAAPARSAPVGVASKTRPRRLPRSLDPDAAGRPRPRAPSHHLA